MIFLSSPAKRLDFSRNWSSNSTSNAVFDDESEEISNTLKKYSVKKLSEKLHISQKLAELNYQRYQSWDREDESKLKPAILAYQGDVYKELDITSLDKDCTDYLQDNFRIITGMYGILKPYDLIQAYRLEMKIKLGEKNLNSLYDFWSQKVTTELNRQIEENNHEYCINLSSQEYSKVIDKSALIKPLVNIKFTQMRDGVIKSIGIHNKSARGLMIRFAAEIKANTLDDLSLFDVGGYRLVSRSEEELVFISPPQPHPSSL